MYNIVEIYTSVKVFAGDRLKASLCFTACQKSLSIGVVVSNNFC